MTHLRNGSADADKTATSRVEARKRVHSGCPDHVSSEERG